MHKVLAIQNTLIEQSNHFGPATNMHANLQDKNSYKVKKILKWVKIWT